MGKFYTVKNNFDCSYKELTSLRECPEEVNDCFDCSHNQLINLEGCPKKVNGIFNCQDNNLTTLKGCPKFVNGNFYCDYNPDLEDISDLPEGVKELCIKYCHNIKVFPRHIKESLTLWYISEEVIERLTQQSHLEIVEEDLYHVTIREKSLGNQLLEAI